MKSKLLSFCYDDFVDLESIKNIYPHNFFPYISINHVNYRRLEDIYYKKGSLNLIQSAFYELHKRVGDKYYKMVYPKQSSALNFSIRSFPSYKFLLPQVLADDWLAIVGWHKKFNRDHALHQPMTAYIVYQLLGGGNENISIQIGEKTLLEWCVDKLLDWDKTKYLKEYLINIGVERKNIFLSNDKDNLLNKFFWRSLFFEVAMVTAIFHDIGYPWQYINSLNNKLSPADFSSDNSFANAEHIFKNFRNRLILYPLNGYKSLKNDVPSNYYDKLLKLISKALSETHGFPGALGFLYLNDIIREYPNNRELPFHQFCVEWAAVGIMMHDLCKIYHGKNEEEIPENYHMRLEFDKDPLSCIITLADIIEEFQRPNVTFKTNYDHSIFKYPSLCKKSEIFCDNDNLNITFKYEDEKAASLKKLYLKKEAKEYFDNNYGYIDLSSIGIKNVIVNAVVD
ncbi:MAG: hypothetical protein HY959_08225 [Ignavibacteriae bacterium]|nr:hypothetical protein [Ignavibacteriota bacterium]